MKKTKNRLKNKIFKIVALGQKNDTMKEYYARRAARLISFIFDYQYMNVFRPWWYEQDWSQHPLEIEHRKFFLKTAEEIESTTGINTKQLNAYLKQFPKRPQREYKEKQSKQQPIRKLKNPESFEISMQDNGRKYKQTVFGEKVFSVKGYEFFIHHDPSIGWVVSDVLAGGRITFASRYKEAIKKGKEIIDKHIDEYIKRIPTITQELGNKL